MALSDEEQRLLAQLEKSLAEDDPKLAHLMRGNEPRTGGRTRNPRHLVAGVLGCVVGLALLVLGIETHWVVSVVGFVVMAASAAVGLGLLNTGRPAASPGSGAPKQRATAKASSASVMDKFEERWRKRQNEGR
ncbi:DUF3040 domain-containing protein [Aestuariimicrobium soli]|uniref:DUF3040 domain-containing protein n=1 Tax=Aestuariimicrobium soli TaxID=2035834 RepID=UPI003EB71991